MPHLVRGSPASLRHEAGTDITDLGEEHGHRVLLVRGKGTKVVLPAATRRRLGTGQCDRGACPRADPAHRPWCPDGPAGHRAPYAQAAVHGPREIPSIAEIRALTEDSRVDLER
jgi:hypothetical protein